MRIEKTDTEYRIVGEAECDSCGGTGLYNGLAERGGARVVCMYCKGQGKINVNISYKKFIQKKVDKECTRVYSQGMGYCIIDKNIAVDGKQFPFADYGCSYQEWLDGAKPKPLKFLGCPYQETNQGLQNKDVNELYEKRCNDNLGFGLIKHCKLFHDKERCWEIYEGVR